MKVKSDMYTAKNYTFSKHLQFSILTGSVIKSDNDISDTTTMAYLIQRF